jgi:hypothetical protein
LVAATLIAIPAFTQMNVFTLYGFNHVATTNLFEVVVMLGLAGGIYQMSRICAVLAPAFYLCLELWLGYSLLEFGFWAPTAEINTLMLVRSYLIVPVLLLGFITALRGIFAYHDNRLQVTKPQTTV